jgi:hypothetical protein
MFHHSDKQILHNADPVLLSVDLVPMTVDLVLMSENQVLPTVDLALLTEDKAPLPKNPNLLFVKEIKTTSVASKKKFHAVLLVDPPHLKLVIKRRSNPHLFLIIKAQF